jgi:NADP-dependent 3-hydroxy acid dehydrogenase YdfG/Flp pilus assembly protein TadD
MQKHTVYVFYSKENEIEAQQISQDFKNANVNCIIDIPTVDKVNKIAQDENATGIIIVSDNYLKCIDQTRYLEVLLNDKYKSQLIPVLTHGRREKEGASGQVEVYATNITTLNNVMYYRDFWYEEWIALRKKSKTAPADQQEDLNQVKEIAKKMSVGSISTYIRRINNIETVDWDTFCDQGYQPFFEKIGEGETSLQERFSYATENDSEVEVLVVETKEELVPVVVVEEVMVEHVAKVVEKKAEEDVPVEEAEEKVEEKKAEEDVPVEEAEEKTEEKTEEVAPVAEMEKKEEVEEEFVLADLENLEEVDSAAIFSEHNIEEVDDIDVLFHIAESKAEEDDFHDARDSYERILKLDPYNGRALIWLARLLARHIDEDAMKAAHTYRKAIMVNDENANLYYEYALLQKDKFKSYNKASDSFREALDINPTFEDAYLGLAFCQKEMGMTDQAKANYLQACALDEARFQTTENDAHFRVIRHVVEVEEEVEGELAEEEEEEVRSPNANTVVLVTGATSGIGKAIAEMFIVDGYKVIMTGRRSERLESMRSELEEQFDETQIHCLPFDVCDLNAVKGALASLPEGWGNVDILINNAGLAKGFAPIQEGNIDHWEMMINTNIKGLLYMSRMVTPGMVERQKGHVINLGSVAGSQVYPDGAVYCATKAAVASLSHSMRLDLFKHNVKVTCINPGHVETEFATVRFDGEEKEDMYDDFKPLSAQDVAEMVFYAATRPVHVNIQDVLFFGTQQASSRDVNKSGRDDK